MPIRKSDPPKVHLEKSDRGTKQCHAGIATPILRSTHDLDQVTCYLCLRVVEVAQKQHSDTPHGLKARPTKELEGAC